MELRKLLKALCHNVCFTIGTEFGEGWLYYYDGESKRDEIPSYLLARNVIDFYDIEGREGDQELLPLNSGYAIIIEGNEKGDI